MKKFFTLWVKTSSGETGISIYQHMQVKQLQETLDVLNELIGGKSLSRRK